MLGCRFSSALYSKRLQYFPRFEACLLEGILFIGTFFFFLTVFFRSRYKPLRNAPPGETKAEDNKKAREVRQIDANTPRTQKRSGHPDGKVRSRAGRRNRVGALRKIKNKKEQNKKEQNKKIKKDYSIKNADTKGCKKAAYGPAPPAR